MNDTDNNPPNTDKFFDIKPSSKRIVSPNSRPIIVDNKPPQSDTMINEEPVVTESPIVEQQQTEETPVDQPMEAPVEELAAAHEEAPEVENDSEPVVASNEKMENEPESEMITQEEELLLPDHATPDEPSNDQVVMNEAVVSGKPHKMLWWIILAIIIVLGVAGWIGYKYVYKSSSSSSQSTNL